MTVFTLSLFRCHTHRGVSGEQPNQSVELRLQRYSRLVPGPPSAAYIQQTLKETTFAHDHQPSTTPTATNNVIHLPLHEFEADPTQFQTDLAQLLSSLHVCASASEMIVREATRAVRGIEEERRLRVVAEVDGVELSWTRPVEREVVEQEEEDDNDNDHDHDEKSEICSICLEELNGGKWGEIEVECGHVFHDFCIYNWLIHNTSCPLCRAPLELDD